MKVDLFETTLRDGEQGAKRTLSPQEKAKIAQKMEQVVGVDILDAGYPGASPLDFEGARQISLHTSKVKLSVLSHGTPSGIRKAASALASHAADRLRIATMHRPLELSVRHRADQTNIQERLIKQAQSAIRVAADLAKEVQYYLVYSGDRDPNFLAELASFAVDAGATHIIIADSQSSMTPERMHATTQRIISAVGGKAIVGAHCHNQLGLALANTLAAVRAGVTQIESCLLGIGDAGGNLATEQFLAYCEHFGSDRDLAAEDALIERCYTNACLPGAISVAHDVASLMQFKIGENQPIVGNRAFTCTTGIHQDHLDHLSHTGFNPMLAGRHWTIALNRHSSRKTLGRELQESSTLPTNMDGELIDSLYSWLKWQTEEVGKDVLQTGYDSILAAYDALNHGKVLILPTTVGYTLATSAAGIKAMKALKGRPDEQPCGILGIVAIYRALFGRDPLPTLPEDLCLAFLGTPIMTPKPVFLPQECIGPSGQVGIWLNLGPIHTYLATRLWRQKGEVMIGSSFNKSGAGNPRSNSYSTQVLDPELRNGQCIELAIPHWLEPELSKEGRWLSAPIFDLNHGTFMRQGRDMEKAHAYAAAWGQFHSQGGIQYLPSKNAAISAVDGR